MDTGPTHQGFPQHSGLGWMVDGKMRSKPEDEDLRLSLIAQMNSKLTAFQDNRG